MIIGIDPGFDGGIIKLLPEFREGRIQKYIMPVVGDKKRSLDLPAIVTIFGKFDGYIKLVVIEKVHSMPKQGVASSFNFGMGYGQLQGICAALQLSVVLVTPQQWKKVILVGYAKPGKGASEKEKKAAAVQYVQQKYPKLDLRKSERCRNPHYGIVDAICLAEYGLWLHSNGGER